MYSAKFNLLFIHIPKNAGQTITKFFMDGDGVPWEQRHKYLLIQNGDPNHGPPQLAHLTIDEYYKSDLISDEIINSATKFAVIRNPWERLWSEYNFYWKHIMSWDEFFKYFPDYIFDDHSTGRDALRHIKPQVDFINDSVELIRFENMYSEFEAFCSRLNIPFHGLQRINCRNSGSYLDMYDSAKIEAVADFYAVDIETFGYEFSK